MLFVVFRCKRLHTLLAGAMQVLHLRMFLSEKGPIPATVLNLIEDLNNRPHPDLLDELSSSELEEFLDAYEEFKKETMDGKHGSTAKYWIIYIELEHRYKLLDRACRTNDLQLFAYALSLICPIFFSCHRPNYARWMTRYQLNLINIDSTHPGLKRTLEDGALSIRRTNKSFSRTAVDLCLEQTVNADTASRKTGISSFMTSSSAKNRWMVTKTARSNIVSCLLMECGLKKEEDVTQQLKPPVSSRTMKPSTKSRTR